MEISLAKIDSTKDVDNYDEPMQLLRVKEVADDSNEDLIKSKLRLKVGVQSCESVGVVRP